MMPGEPWKCLVLDTNLLLRAVLGVKVPTLLATYVDSVVFCAPDICFAEARRHIPTLAVRKGYDATVILAAMDELSHLVEMIDPALYAAPENAARARIVRRDPDDWPIVATALLLGCPIWTEDRDFFGCGIATWTTQTIEIYLRA